MTIDIKRLRELRATINRPEYLDTSFARAAHAALPELLDELERLQEERDSAPNLSLLLALRAENARLRESLDMKKTFRLLIEIDVPLTVEEIWPDGEAPENPTPEDVAYRMDTAGTLGRFIDDWNLSDGALVEVDGWPVRLRQRGRPMNCPNRSRNEAGL